MSHDELHARIAELERENQRLRELERANERLRVREQQLEEAQRMGNIGSWEYDVTRDTVYWSTQLYRIVGLRPGEIEHDARAILRLVHEHDRAEYRARHEQVLAHGGSMDLVHRVVRPDGDVRHVRTVCELLESGEGPMLTGTAQDVTELLEARAQSTRLAERLWETLEQISDGFFTMDADWRITFVNHAAERQMRIARADVLGRTLWEVYPVVRGTGFERNYRRAVETRDAVFFQEYFPPLEAWFDVRAYPTEGGLLVYFHDATEARQRQAQLQLLQTAVSRLNDIVVITEADPLDSPGPRIVYVNEAFEKHTGYRRDEVIGRNPRFLQGPETRRSELDRIRRALDTGQPVRSELVNYTRSGGELRLELDIVPIVGDAGVITHFVAVQRDVTEQRELEAQLRQAQRLDAIGQLTGGVAHDFNNLLTVILGNADLLMDQLADDDKLHRLAGLTKAAAERGSVLTNRLLAFARRQALDPTSTDVGDLLRGMHGLLSRTLGDDIEIVVSVAADTWPAMVDAPQLETALLNLCINARDAMARGGRIAVEAGNARLGRAADRDAVATPGDYVAITVTDTGEGMTAEVLAKAFEPFYTTKEPGKGSGLGLSMVYGFAKQSAGHVEMDSEPGHGTRVRLYLPRAVDGGSPSTLDDSDAVGS
ncbi:MAG: PAS domain S-box protein [Pseudomonadota bacterium]